MMNELKETRKSMTKILLVQWSRFGAVPIKVNGSTLFTGVNGSGKSTILDALTYALTGNTQFNEAAGDRDRTVLSYVRGDTKSNGQYKYLRKGNIISYIAVEFFSPADNFYITVGVCIESVDEQSHNSFWFALKDTKISDINFYFKDKTQLNVTPKNQLKQKNKPIAPAEFLRKEKGVEKVQRMLGIRGETDTFKRKITKMMSFKPENNIDKFIRDSVLPEKKIETLDNLKEQKQQFEDIKSTYEKILKMQVQLNDVEEKAVQYEKCERQLNLKRAELFYQNFIIAEKKLKDNTENIQYEKGRLERLNLDSIEAEKSFKAAMDRKNKYEKNDLLVTIKEKKQQIEEIQGNIDKAQHETDVIVSLQKKIRDIVEQSDIADECKSILLQLENAEISAGEKYKALSTFEKFVNVKTDLLMRRKWETDNKIEQNEKKLEEIDQSIKNLENNIADYPKLVVQAKNEINKELAERKINAQVRTFAELVKTVEKPEWRDALEVYLRNKKFDLIIESQYVSDALEIFHRNKYHKINLVLTDKFEEYTAMPNSAASILDIPNREARLYANYLLGRLHLCDTLEELHDHPKGGIMKDGTVAQSLTVYNMSLDKIDYYLGQDSFRLQLESKKKEFMLINDETNKYREEAKKLEMEIQMLKSLDLSGKSYRFEAVNELAENRVKLSENKTALQEMEDDPTLTTVMEQYEKADREFKEADNVRAEIKSKIAICNNKIREMECNSDGLQKASEKAKVEFEQFILMHLELKKEAISEYERLSKNDTDGIAVAPATIERYERELNKASKTLEDSQMKYCALSGKNIEERGPSFIPAYRAERNEIINVNAEETKNKLSAKQKELESAFVTDFIALLCGYLDEAQKEISAINSALGGLPFGQDIYSFVAMDRKDKASFFRIKNKLYDEVFDLRPDFLQKINDDIELQHDLEDFLETIISEDHDFEYTDYRTYYIYDMKIKNHIQSADIETDLSAKQGSASNGEKQTPYFIILAASLMQCYPYNSSCARLAFIDEAFSALSQDRIEQMVRYFEQNGFQVMYAAPPEKINSIGKFIDSTVSLVETGRYTNVVEGLADEFIK